MGGPALPLGSLIEGYIKSNIAARQELWQKAFSMMELAKSHFQQADTIADPNLSEKLRQQGTEAMDEAHKLLSQKPGVWPMISKAIKKGGISLSGLFGGRQGQAPAPAGEPMVGPPAAAAASTTVGEQAAEEGKAPSVPSGVSALVPSGQAAPQTGTAETTTEKNAVGSLVYINKFPHIISPGGQPVPISPAEARKYMMQVGATVSASQASSAAELESKQTIARQIQNVLQDNGFDQQEISKALYQYWTGHSFPDSKTQIIEHVDSNTGDNIISLVDSSSGRELRSFTKAPDALGAKIKAFMQGSGLTYDKAVARLGEEAIADQQVARRIDELKRQNEQITLEINRYKLAMEKALRDSPEEGVRQVADLVTNLVGRAISTGQSPSLAEDAVKIILNIGWNSFGIPPVKMIEVLTNNKNIRDTLNNILNRPAGSQAPTGAPAGGGQGASIPPPPRLIPPK